MYYTPNAQNVPLFEGKKEANISGALAMALQSRGINVQVAYAPVNHLGIMCNYHYWGAKWSGSSPWYDEGSHKGSLIELGAGYFTKLDERMVVETYAGFGWFATQNTYPYNKSSEMRGYRYFIQAATGWHFKAITIGPSLRVVGMYYRELEYIYIHNNDPDSRFQALIDNPFLVYLEPGFVLRTGGEKIKFQAQINISFPTQNSDVLWDPVSISVGMFIPIRPKKIDKNGK